MAVWISALTTHSLQVVLGPFSESAVWRDINIPVSRKVLQPPLTAYHHHFSYPSPFIVCLLLWSSYTSFCLIRTLPSLYSSNGMSSTPAPSSAQSHLQMLATLSLPLLIRVLDSSTANRATLMQTKSTEKAKMLL